MMKIILILSHPFNIQGREPFLCDFIKKRITLACIQSGLISFKLGLMIRTVKLYLVRSDSMTFTFYSKSQFSEKLKTFMSIFWQNLIIDIDEIQYIATTCWFVETHAKFSLQSGFSRERTSSCVRILCVNQFLSNLV